MEPTQKELDDSIDSLKVYRDRLRSEIINISHKLRMSKIKIEETLQDNSELRNIENVIEKLTAQRNSQEIAK